MSPHLLSHSRPEPCAAAKGREAYYQACYSAGGPAARPASCFWRLHFGAMGRAAAQLRPHGLLLRPSCRHGSWSRASQFWRQGGGSGGVARNECSCTRPAGELRRAAQQQRRGDAHSGAGISGRSVRGPCRQQRSRARQCGSNAGVEPAGTQGSRVAAWAWATGGGEFGGEESVECRT
jgi:hypothetical protein